MADVQFRDAFQFGDGADVVVRQAVAGVERQAAFAHHARGPGERRPVRADRGLPSAARAYAPVCSSTASAPSSAASSTCFGSGSRNRLTMMPASRKRRTASATAVAVADRVEAPFGGHFLASLRHERGLIGPDAAGDRQHVFVAGQFEIQLDRHGLAENFQIAILDMAAIFAEVDRDAVGAAQLGQSGGPNRIGLVRPPGLPERGDVVDVDAEVRHEAEGVRVRGREVAVQGYYLQSGERLSSGGVDSLWTRCRRRAGSDATVADLRSEPRIFVAPVVVLSYVSITDRASSTRRPGRRNLSRPIIRRVRGYGACPDFNPRVESVAAHRLVDCAANRSGAFAGLLSTSISRLLQNNMRPLHELSRLGRCHRAVSAHGAASGRGPALPAADQHDRNLDALEDDGRLADAWQEMGLRLQAATDQHAAMTEELEQLAQTDTKAFTAEQVWVLIRAIKVQSQILQLYLAARRWRCEGTLRRELRAGRRRSHSQCAAELSQSPSLSVRRPNRGRRGRAEESFPTSAG